MAASAATRLAVRQQSRVAALELFGRGRHLREDDAISVTCRTVLSTAWRIC
jgi:hypothetical protein